ncbi:MAG: hexose kinase [Elusimicrobiaceae bacterium]
MNKILVVNLNFAVAKTAVVDEFRDFRVYRLARVETLPGGKGMNVARALRALGCSARIIGFIAGNNGSWIAQTLKKERFPAELVPFSPGESRFCLSVADAGGVSMEFNEEGDSVPCSAQVRFVKRFERALENCHAVALSGRMCAGLPHDFFNKLIAIAKRAGVLCAVDTSGVPLRKVIEAGPELIKINREEFEFLAGARLTPANLLKIFRRAERAGTQYLIVTDGPKPAWAVAKGRIWKYSPPKIRVVTPVGAGDSCLAGLLYGFLKRMSNKDCVKFALGAAASDCMSVRAGDIVKDQCAAVAARVKCEEHFFS